MTTQVKLDSLQEICERLVMGHGSARDELIQAAMPLAENWVKRTIRKFPSAKRLQDDLTSEAYLSLVGLSEGLHRKSDFDVTKIKSYLNTGIKNALNKLLDNEALVGPSSETLRLERSGGESKAAVEFLCDPETLDALPDHHGGNDVIDAQEEIDACCEYNAADDVDPEIEEEVQRAKERGLSHEEIVTETGVDHSTVLRALIPTERRVINLRIQGPRVTFKRPSVTPRTFASFEEIAKCLDASKSTVERLFKNVVQRLIERNKEDLE
jgi:RNA polymerase sigma factor (sigma-70 family)